MDTVTPSAVKEVLIMSVDKISSLTVRAPQASNKAHSIALIWWPASWLMLLLPAPHFLSASAGCPVLK